jgi:hypothetical protein
MFRLTQPHKGNLAVLIEKDLWLKEGVIEHLENTSEQLKSNDTKHLKEKRAASKECQFDQK